jgi:hypothetical protein
MVIWYIFSSLGILSQEKSGNPGGKSDLGSEVRGRFFKNKTRFRNCEARSKLARLRKVRKMFQQLNDLAYVDKAALVLINSGLFLVFLGRQAFQKSAVPEKE